MLFPLLAQAQTGPRIELDPHDNPLMISGSLGDDSSFVGNVRLVARGGNIDSFAFLPSDLQSTKGRIIGRDHLELIGDRSLESDVPKDFQVKVTGLKSPDTYNGTIRFVIPGQAITETNDISLNIKITANAPDVRISAPTLTITGWLDNENSVLGSLQLTAQGTDVAGFTFQAPNLKIQEGSEVIGAQDVTLLGEHTLVADIPKDFQLKVANVKVPGTYTGTAHILLPGNATIPLPLVVQAKAPPALVPLAGTDIVQLQLVQCENLGCLPAWGLPASAFLDQAELQFKNTAPSSLVISGIRTVVSGEQTHYQLTDTQIFLIPTTSDSNKQNKSSTRNQIVTVPLAISRRNIPPDHYTGSIYLYLEGATEPVVVAINMSVRTGPWLPLLVLLFGILLGRLVKYMNQSGGGNDQANALLAAKHLERRIDAANQIDQDILKPLLEQVEQLVYTRQLDQAEDKRKVLESYLETLNNMRRIENVLADPSANRTPDPEIQGKINEIRHLMKDSLDPLAVGDQIAELAASVSSSYQPGLEGGPVTYVKEALKPLIEKLNELSQNLLAWDKSVLSLSVSQFYKLKRLVVLVAGLSDKITAEATLWVVRPLLYVVLLGFLLWLGFDTLYYRSATFGTNPFPDYVSLIFWGLSSDVAGRTLVDLKVGSQ
jgi:hypothetical protein